MHIDRNESQFFDAKSPHSWRSLAVISTSILISLLSMLLSTPAIAQEAPPVIWTDDILEFPKAEQGQMLSGIDESFIALPEDESGDVLSGSNGESFSDLQLVSSDGTASVEEYTANTTAHFWYQSGPGYWSEGEFQDDVFSPAEAAALKSGVNLMMWVLNTQMDTLMACVNRDRLVVIPDEYVTAYTLDTMLDTDKLARDLGLTLNSSKQVHIVIGAFDKRRNDDNSITAGVTWQSVIDSRPGKINFLSDINNVRAALIGINLNVGPDASTVNYNYLFDGPKAAAIVFHEILHNYGFGHDGNASGDYNNRSKAILALEDCMLEIARNHSNGSTTNVVAMSPQEEATFLINASIKSGEYASAVQTFKDAKSVMGVDLPDPLAKEICTRAATADRFADVQSFCRQIVNNDRNHAAITAEYYSQTDAFVETLLLLLSQFQLPDLGITSATMTDALLRPDAALRINATVNRVWADWLPYGPKTVQTDPKEQGLTPFRVLVIRMIQGRQLQLTAAEQHALYNLLTRPDPIENWRNDMNGIIGAINSESFQTQFQTGNAVVVGATAPQTPETVEEPQQPNSAPGSTEPVGSPKAVARTIQEVARIADFESFGVWKRGDEAWGTFNQSSERRSGGQYSGKLVYDFPAIDNNYVVFRRTFSLPTNAGALRAQVYGDGSTHFLNAWVQDAKGQLWQFTFGRIQHTGWQEMTAVFDTSRGWPNQAIDTPNDTTLDSPLSLYALVLDGYDNNRASSGEIYVDDLEAVVYLDGTVTTVSSDAKRQTPAVVQQPADSQQKATVTAPTLNVRSGPSANSTIVGKVKIGDILFVLERSSGWIRVAFPEAPDGVGWVAEGYVRLMAEPSKSDSTATVISQGSDIPDTSVPATPQEAVAVSDAEPDLRTSESAVSGTPVAITGFEQWGTWRRGDEAWGTFAQSGEQVADGNSAGKLEYAFQAGAANNYVVFRTDLPISGQPSALQVQVYGDGSTNFLNAWVKDAAGNVWQFTFGRINHTGWQTMIAPLDLDAGWPNQMVSGNGASLTFPIRLAAVVLDGHTDVDLSGTVYLDELAAITP